MVAKLETLRQARTRRGVSIRELAVLSATSPGTVHAIERGLRPAPHPRTMRRIAGALGVREAAISEFAAAMGRAAQGRG